MGNFNSNTEVFMIYLKSFLPIYGYTKACFLCNLQNTLTGHFVRYTLHVPGWTPFCIQNCLNSLWYRFNNVVETFLRDFGPYWHDNITQLLQICRCTSIIRISRSTTSQRCSILLLDWDLVTVEAIWVKWTHCHVQETSLRWFELCDMVHYPAGSSHQKMYCSI